MPRQATTNSSNPGRASHAPTLGVVAISYNEEANIRGFLDNLLPWVDEIVIVDDGSTDDTENIARRFEPGVKFLASPRQEGEYFSHQRNKGIDAASSDWLLHMDIDERVSPQLASEILRQIQNSSLLAYRYRRRNHFMNRPMLGGGWQSWNLVHLARRERLRFGGMYHESIELDCSEEQTGQLSGYMYHLNELNLWQRLRKSDTYLGEVTAAIRASGKKIRGWHLLVMPAREFVKRYLFKRGFLDGVPGWISAVHSCTALFRAYALVWEEQHPVSREDLEAQIKQEWRRAGGPDRTQSLEPDKVPD